jgi:hypothetical protein
MLVTCSHVLVCLWFRQAVRKSLLQPATQALFVLVSKYPMVSFHQKSQRFAVGTDPQHGSVVIIYDLRTATKWRILEGHKGVLAAVAFNSSAERYGAGLN